MTLAEILAPHGFVQRKKGARRAPFARLDYATAKVIGECHLYGNTYDPRGHDYQILVVKGTLENGQVGEFAACRRGDNYAIGQLYDFVPAK